jgi:hypothetical protein
MVAGRRDRMRSLIRSKVTVAAMTRNLSPQDGVAALQRKASSEVGLATPVFPDTMSALQPELTTYLRQLSTLHLAGILSDEEFSAARGRLLGS